MKTETRHIEVKGALYLRKWSWQKDEDADLCFYANKPEASDRWPAVEVVPDFTLSADVPVELDWTPVLVEAIQAEITKVRAESTKKLTELQEKLNSILAIEDKTATIEADDGPF
jgi:hypothetical protein